MVTSSRWSSKSPNATCRCSWTYRAASEGESDEANWNLELGENAAGSPVTGLQFEAEGGEMYGYREES